MNKGTQELAIMAAVLIIAFFFFCRFDVFEMIFEWSRKYEEYQIDEIVSTLIVFAVLLVIFAIRRWIELKRQSRELQRAMAEVKTLRGIIPICSYCKKIRDDKGAWTQMEEYINSHSESEFSHGVCPECYKKQMEEME